MNEFEERGRLGRAVGFYALLTLGLAFVGCADEEPTVPYRQRMWSEPCHDFSKLLATTAGSPDDIECPNKEHEMIVQVVTTSTQEEAAALVFCKCRRKDRAAGAP